MLLDTIYYQTLKNWNSVIKKVNIYLIYNFIYGYSYIVVEFVLYNVQFDSNLFC